MADRPKLTLLGGNHSASGYILTLAATVTDEQFVWKNNTGARVTITKAGYVPDTAVTGAATNNMALQFKVKSAAGAAVTTLTAVKTYANTVDIAQFAEDALVLTTTVAALIIEAGESVTLEKTENGTGLALPAGHATLTYKFDA